MPSRGYGERGGVDQRMAVKGGRIPEVAVDEDLDGVIRVVQQGEQRDRVLFQNSADR
jgi:hypothetical protein